MSTTNKAFTQGVEMDSVPSGYDPEVDSVSPRKGFRKLYLAAFAAWMGSVSMGAVLGYSSPALHSMEKPHSHFKHLTLDEQSWVGSIMAIGALIGGIVAGPVIEKFGRKTTLIFVVVPFTFGWLSIAFSGTLFPMLLGRLLTGLTTGMISLTVPVYISEIATSDVRGILGSSVQLCTTIGILITYLLGELVEWIWLAILCSIFPCICAVMMAFMPESPYWLLKKGQRQLSLNAIKFLNGNTVKPEEVCSEMETNLAQQPQGRVSFMELTHAQNLKPIILVLGLMFFQQFSGINGVMFYAAKIFQDAGYDSIPPSVSGIILAAAQVVGTLIGSAISDKAGRRILLISSGGVMGIGLVILATVLALGEKNGASFLSQYGWLTVASLSLFIMAFSISFGPTPWLMMGELLPARVKGLSSSIATAFNWFLCFIITKEFNDMLNGMKSYGAYFFFATFCFISVVFVAILIPETKGKTLEEIEQLFASDKFKKSDEKEMVEPEI